MPLSGFRKRIDEIDEQIVDLLARRFAVAHEVAEHKRDGGAPMMQPERMREVVDRVVLLAGERGLSLDLARKLYDSITEETCELEAEIISGGANGAGRPERGLPERALAIDHVAIAVRSLSDAVEHFSGSFGFEVVEEREVAGEFSGMNTAVLTAGGVKLVLVQGTSPASNVSQYIERYGPGVQHLAIRVDRAGTVLDDLQERGCDLLTGVIHADGLDQVFTRRDANSGMQVEIISRSENEGFSDSNVRELFEAMEREHVF
jgi:chorismate mutase/catechol 2,3-dioxygenase-like lactoylglutathione lyase family enzyme